VSPKELPPSGRSGDLTALLRSRHTAKEKPAATGVVAVTVDPFTPQPLNPAAVTGTPEERLTAFEAAIDSAKETAGTTLKAARARFAVEAGMALRAIRDEDGGLYKVTHATFEEYVAVRWDMDRTRAYQLIDAAPAMLVMWKIFDTAPVESQARALAGVLDAHGEEAVREAVVAVRESGKKITAATLKEAAHRLHYIPQPAPEPDEPDDLPTEHTPEQARALVRLEKGLAELRVAHKALRGRVIPDAVMADHVRGSELVAEIADLAGKISRLTR
jgi:hypothetical protein